VTARRRCPTRRRDRFCLTAHLRRAIPLATQRWRGTRLGRRGGGARLCLSRSRIMHGVFGAPLTANREPALTMANRPGAIRTEGPVPPGQRVRRSPVRLRLPGAWPRWPCNSRPGTMHRDREGFFESPVERATRRVPPCGRVIPSISRADRRQTRPGVSARRLRG